jgi:hypothetical protein
MIPRAALDDRIGNPLSHRVVNQAEISGGRNVASAACLRLLTDLRGTTSSGAGSLDSPETGPTEYEQTSNAGHPNCRQFGRGHGRKRVGMY